MTDRAALLFAKVSASNARIACLQAQHCEYSALFDEAEKEIQSAIDDFQKQTEVIISNKISHFNPPHSFFCHFCCYSETDKKDEPCISCDTNGNFKARNENT